MNAFQKAVQYYERLTHETVGYQNYTEYRDSCWFDPNKISYMKVLSSGEFLIWEIQKKDGLFYLWLGQTYAKSFSVFVPFIRHVMEVNELEYIITATQRNPKMHIRKWKMERLTEHDYCFEGRFYYVLKGHKSNLK